ncbi:FecR family protein [Chitinophaga alhagiae]|uniref:FecR family protein n=1 Tax=Chitinophaga alhagiae TaxID=2203219 RepID=UPI000E5B8745|nr:FecR family protein [Chitinophaga alhagiae]
MENKAFYQRLVRRYMENKASDEELEVFFHLLERGLLDEPITAYMNARADGNAAMPDVAHQEAGGEAAAVPGREDQARIHRISPPTHREGALRISLRKRWWAAAALAGLLLAAGAVYFMQGSKKPPPLAQQPVTPRQDIAPGGDHAVLTLADGSTITLDSAGNGSLSTQGGTTIYKHAGGKLAYQAGGTSQVVQYNTLSTPRGGKYQVLLPDGTSVVLNAASSLRFPTAFTGSGREVELNGEAYFEVAGNAAAPFRVKVRPAAGSGPERMIEVLGTSFNIMAYEDEPVMKTTLVSGAVRVTGEGVPALLRPGQQAVISNSGAGGVRVENAALDEALAWTRNEFQFSNTNIYSIMRQISRWYNVDVSYEDSLHVFLNGNIRKNVPASQVFKMLELTGEVRFRTENGRVTVSSVKRP